jgi:3-phosphoshikimate 1-carboxyvinyltransferase
VVHPAARLRGELRVPGDKSITHRALLLGAIGRGSSRFAGPGIGADTRATAAVIEALGVEHRLSPAALVVQGGGLTGLREPADVLDCRNSGTTIRLATGLLAGRPFHSFLTGDASLRRRPMDRIVEPLRAMGAELHARAGGTRAPIAIAPARLHGLDFRQPVASAQVKSALLLAAIQADSPTTIRQPAVSRDHTERMLAAQGASIRQASLAVVCEPSPELGPLDMAIPGDISSAAFWMVAAALHPDAELVIRDVGLNPTRTGIIDVLQRMNADLKVELERSEPEPIGTVTARSSELRAVTVEGELIPRLIDEVPLVALLATQAQGTTRITDAQELAVKESDRLASTASAVGALGGEIEATEDGFWVAGGGLSGGEADSAGDHRIAMLLAIAGLTGTGPATIYGAQAVDVSYPSFWDDLEAVAR